MTRWLALLLLFGLALAPSARAADAAVTGTAAYRERIALPPGARFEAMILDASRADAPAETLAKTVIDNPGQPPIAFSIPYDPAKLNPRARYVLRATIAVDGKLWFTTDTANPVLNGGKTSGFKLLLRRVSESPRKAPAGAGAGPNWPLVNTYWKIVELKGEALTPVEGKREGSLILRAGKKRQVAATVGCNRMAGGYDLLKGGGLTFGRFASTMMACPPPLDARERALSEVLANTRSYAIAGSTLTLYDERRNPLAVLYAVALY